MPEAGFSTIWPSDNAALIPSSTILRTMGSLETV